MNVNFSPFLNREPKQPKVKNKGLLPAYYLSGFAAVPTKLASKGVSKLMMKASELDHNDSVMLRRAAQEGLKQTGLYDKGVRAYTFKEVKMPDMKQVAKDLMKNPEKFAQKMEDTFNEGDISSSFSKMFETFFPVKYGKKDAKALGAFREEIQIVSEKVQKNIARFQGQKELSGMAKDMKDMTDGFSKAMADMMAKVQAIPFKTGKNACFLPHVNKILTPDKHLQTSIFHEMGHALNYNGGGILKALQKMRPAAMLLPGVIMAVSLANKRKTTDEKSDNKVQNFFDGIKRNAGKLSFLAMTPMLAEEGIASLRGGALAKNLTKQGVLTKNILNKVRLTNAAGFATYVGAAVGTALVSKAAVAIKDKYQAKYEEKLDMKYQQKLEKYEACEAGAGASKQ